MNKRTWFIMITGFTATIILVCAGLFGLVMWLTGSESDGSFGFGEGIALIRVEGVIVPGEAPPPSPFGNSSAGMAYSQRVISHLKQANADDDVKSVVLYIDSPGGSVFASDEIYLHLAEKMDKPVIVSMGSLAASGGYYIAAPAQEIWASPHTLTCSIGVISQFLNLDDFGEEYGINMVTVKSGRFKDTGNPFREFSEADRALWQAIIDEAYEDFVGIVVAGRTEQMTEAEVRQIADGRVCTGRQAQEAGLVDSLGYLPEVIEHAADLAGIEGEPRVIEYGNEPTLFEGLGIYTQPDPVDEFRRLMHYHPGSPLMYLYVGP